MRRATCASQARGRTTCCTTASSADRARPAPGVVSSYEPCRLRGDGHRPLRGADHHHRRVRERAARPRRHRRARRRHPARAGDVRGGGADRDAVAPPVGGSRRRRRRCRADHARRVPRQPADDPVRRAAARPPLDPDDEYRPRHAPLLPTAITTAALVYLAMLLVGSVWYGLVRDDLFWATLFAGRYALSPLVLGSALWAGLVVAGTVAVSRVEPRA